MSARAKYNDPNGPHARIYHSLLNCPAWRLLSWSSRALFMDLRATLGKTNNGDLKATLNDPNGLKHRGWNSASTLANGLHELVALGFLEKTRGGGVANGSKICCLYRFTDVDMFDIPKHGIEHKPATKDFMKFATLADAEQALQAAGVRRKERAAEQKRKKDARKEKTTIRKSKRDDSKIEAMGPCIDSKIEVERVPSIRKSKQRKEARNGL